MYKPVKLLLITFLLFSTISLVQAQTEKTEKPKKAQTKKDAKTKANEKKEAKAKAEEKKEAKNKSGDKKDEDEEEETKDSNLWIDARTIETDYYSIKIPSAWTWLPNMSKGIENTCYLNGVGVPSSYNGANVLASMFISRQSGDNLDNATSLLKASLSKKGDSGIGSQKETSTKVKGSSATMLKTIYPSFLNGRDAVRYDVVVFSDKGARAYTFTLLIQVRNIQKLLDDNPTDDLFKEIMKNIKIK